MVSKHSNRFWVFEAGNLNGGFDSDQKASQHGVGFSITVQDISKSIEAIQKHGGKIVKQAYPLGKNTGFCASFTDPNGNLLELYSTTHTNFIPTNCNSD